MTIKAVDKYIDKTGDKNLKYYIVGCGSEYETQKIIDTISLCKNPSQIHYEGEKRGNELNAYFSKCNIGVAYVPLCDYYDKQPPTKTYEYLLNSMAVIATPTTENKKIISEKNGVILEDDDEISFVNGLEKIVSKEFDTKEIFEENICYSWSNLTKTFLLPIIK